MRIIFSLILSLLTTSLIQSQIDLSTFKDVESVIIQSHWGNINITGTTSKAKHHFSLSATHTDARGKLESIDNCIHDYVQVSQGYKEITIICQPPKGFESVDLRLNIPTHIFAKVLLFRGGEINIQNLHKGVEIDSRNGSIQLSEMRGYALVSATNGSIDAHFSDLYSSMPVSLVSMNGEIKVALPEDSKREVRLISRKNGFVLSDFELALASPIPGLNQRVYSKSPIVNTAQINGGGALLFLSTENGPIIINQSS